MREVPAVRRVRAHVAVAIMLIGASLSALRAAPALADIVPPYVQDPVGSMAIAGAGSRAATFATYASDDGAFRERETVALAEHDDDLLAAYVDGRAYAELLRWASSSAG